MRKILLLLLALAALPSLSSAQSAAGVTGVLTPPSSGGGGGVYPGAGIPNSTGTAWGTSYSTSGSGTTLALTNSPTFITPILGIATASGLDLSNITGSVQCLHVDSLGNVSGTGADCGAGGAVSSVSGSSGITVSPTTGATVVSLAAQAAHTLMGNASGASAAPGAIAISSSALADLQASTPFTVAGTGCTPTVGAAGPFAGTVTLAAGPCTAITITFNGATGFTAPNGWHCSVDDRTALSAGTWIPGWAEDASTATTATIPIPGAAGATDVLSVGCTYF